jgi:LPXTG-motif cell wall-anchored protein
MAARNGHPSTGGRVSSRPIPNSVQDSFVTLLAIAYVIVLAAIVFGFLRYRHRWQERPSNWLTNFLLVTVLMLVATAIGYYGMTHSNLRHRVAHAQSQQARRGSGTSGSRLHPRPVPAREAQFQWPLALGVGGLLLLGGVLIYVRRRRDALPVGGESLEAEIAAAVETTIDDLRNERDARRAVIAAYAQMERTLGAHGFRRNAAEAPFEYLGRILRGLDVRDSAVRTLTDLFEYAKFSPHEIDAAMKDDAIGALLTIRDDLQRQEELAA